MRDSGFNLKAFVLMTGEPFNISVASSVTHSRPKRYSRRYANICQGLSSSQKLLVRRICIQSKLLQLFKRHEPEADRCESLETPSGRSRAPDNTIYLQNYLVFWGLGFSTIISLLPILKLGDLVFEHMV